MSLREKQMGGKKPDWYDYRFDDFRCIGCIGNCSVNAGRIDASPDGGIGGRCDCNHRSGDWI